MTRINIISPDQLTDAHLFAERYEIVRLPKYYAKSPSKVPTAHYTMGKKRVVKRHLK